MSHASKIRKAERIPNAMARRIALFKADELGRRNAAVGLHAARERHRRAVEQIDKIEARLAGKPRPPMDSLPDLDKWTARRDRAAREISDIESRLAEMDRQAIRDLETQLSEKRNPR